MKALDWESKDLEKYRKLSTAQAEEKLNHGHKVLCLVGSREVNLLSAIAEFKYLNSLTQQRVYNVTYYEYTEESSTEKVKDLGVKQVQVKPAELSPLTTKDLQEYLGVIPVICEVFPGCYCELNTMEDLKKVLPCENAENKIKFYIE